MAEETIEFKKNWDILMDITINPFLERIETLTEEALEKQSIPQSEFQMSYQIIFSLCTKRSKVDFCKKFYEKHSDLLSSYCTERIIPNLENVEKSDGITFCKKWNEIWRKYCWVIDGLKRIFQYIDRFYVENCEGVENLSKKGFSTFRKLVFERFGSNLRESVLQYIKNERLKGNLGSRAVFKQAIEITRRLENEISEKLYENVIEKQFFEDSKEFFKTCGRSLLTQKCSFSLFLKKTEALYECEKIRVQQIMPEGSAELLLRILIEELMRLHYKEFVYGKEEELVRMFQEDRLDDLAMAYLLYSRQKNSRYGMESLADAFGKDTSRLLKCSTLPGTKKRPKIEKSERTTAIQLAEKKISSALRIKAERRRMIKMAFGDHISMNRALHRELERHLNSDGSLAPHFAYHLISFVIAKDNAEEDSFGDRLKRDGNFSDVIKMVRYVREKNIFEKVFQILLVECTLNENMREKGFQTLNQILKCLEKATGITWTFRAENIRNDIKESNQLYATWKNCQPNSVLTVCTVSRNCWPLVEEAELALPKALRAECQRFEGLYSKLHPKKKLRWRLDQGRAILKVRFGASNVCSISVTTVQMLILLTFNKSGGAVSFDEIRHKAHIPSRLLRFHLQFMCSGGDPVLKRVSCPAEACPLVGDEFYKLNCDFRKRGTIEPLPEMGLKRNIPPFFSEHFDLFSKKGVRRESATSQGEDNGNYCLANMTLFSDFGSVKELKEEAERNAKTPYKVAEGTDGDSDSASGSDRANNGSGEWLRSGRCHAERESSESELETATEATQLHEEAIDSALMRVLKQKQAVREAELYAEVRRALRGSPNAFVSRTEVSERLRRLANMEFVRLDMRDGLVRYIP